MKNIFVMLLAAVIAQNDLGSDDGKSRSYGSPSND